METSPSNNFFSPVEEWCKKASAEFDQIPAARKAQLERLSNYIFKKVSQGLTPEITVICTHNSRRSHYGQLMLAVAADYYGLSPFATYSGGTEATAFNPRAVAALRRAGFTIDQEAGNSENPVYAISWREGQTAYRAFSKRYDDAPNPRKDFAAILVCAEAEAGCPVVLGSDLRLPLPYEDPKAYDDTPQEEKMYTERLWQFAREMLYVIEQRQAS